MNPIREALSKILKEDGQLKALATGVYHRKAPSGAALPYVIFHKASGNPVRTFDGPSLDKDVWLVKGVGERDVSEDIDKRCKEILSRADLDIEGKVHQDLYPISDVDFDEVLNGERVNHVGAEYKLDSEDE